MYLNLKTNKYQWRNSFSCTWVLKIHCTGSLSWHSHRTWLRCECCGHMHACVVITSGWEHAMWKVLSLGPCAVIWKWQGITQGLKGLKKLSSTSQEKETCSIGTRLEKTEKAGTDESVWRWIAGQGGVSFAGASRHEQAEWTFIFSVQFWFADELQWCAEHDSSGWFTWLWRGSSAPKPGYRQGPLYFFLFCQWYCQWVFGIISMPSFPPNIKQTDIACYYSRSWYKTGVKTWTGWMWHWCYAPRAHPRCKKTKITKYPPC